MAHKRKPSLHGGYGWLPDLPDARDHYYTAAPLTMATMPSSVDLRAKCPAVYDQGQLGSCTANGVAAAIEFDLMKQGKTVFTPSRLFIYWNERAIEGTTDQDSGAMIRDGVKSVASLGAPPETDWPYDVTQFTAEPPPEAYADALNYRAISYARVVQEMRQMKGCLAEGAPFVFGFSVYDSFESDIVASTGVVPMPSASDTLLGGHCVVAVGYDDSNQWFICRNSWGAGWGDQGYFYMPYLYLASATLAQDFWRINIVSEPST